MTSVHLLLQLGRQCASRARRKSKNPPPSENSFRRHGLAAATLTQTISGLALLVLLCAPLHAQTIEDGVMVARHTLFSGTVYTHDSWDHYWEGTLNRTNGNIGTVTTQTITFSGNYGFSNRFNFIMNVPYVWTNASKGVLGGRSGFQDLTMALKYDFLHVPVKEAGTLSTIGLVYVGLPMTTYSPDFQPLSIGTASERISTRLTANYQGRNGVYVNATGAYTWRNNVTLDRSSYYTNGHLYFSNQVAMPNVYDYALAAGYYKRGVMLTGDFTSQRTQGGGDIRRQDMPFVSNRVNFSRAGGTAMFPIPKLNGLCALVTYNYTFDGRNVGQSNAITTGLMYTLPLERLISK